MLKHTEKAIARLKGAGYKTVKIDPYKSVEPPAIKEKGPIPVTHEKK